MGLWSTLNEGGRSGWLIAAGLGTATLTAWGTLYIQQAGMAHQAMEPMWMPPTGTWLWTARDFALVFSMWAIMMLAMMLPVATPMALLLHRMNRVKAAGLRRMSLPGFLAGYLLIWLGFSAAVTGLQWLFHGFGWLTPMMESGNTAMSGIILMLAGAYQFTPWKVACLGHCRTPLGLLLSRQWPDDWGGLRLGLYHGRHCLGCCWAEMLVMFAVGVMNVFWMGGITLAIVAERYLPNSGDFVRKLTGIGLLGLGMAQWR